MKVQEMFFKVAVVVVAILPVSCAGLEDSDDEDKRRGGLRFEDPTRLQVGGHEAGNGGDAIVCEKDGYVTSVELLDYFEGAERWDFEIDLDDPDPIVAASGVIERIRRHDPARAEILQGHLDRFHGETKFWSNIELAEVNDSRHVAKPKNCEVRQIAVQKTPSFEQEKYYIVSADLYNLLSPEHQAGLILHEIIYRYMLSLWGSESFGSMVSSTPVRYFNAFISSSKAKDMSFLDYVNLLRSTQFKTIQILDDTHDLELFIDGMVWQEDVLLAGNLFRPGWIKRQDMTFALDPGPFAFHESGTFSVGRLSSPMDLTLGERTFPIAADFLEISAEGTLMTATFAKPTMVTTRNGQRLEVTEISTSDNSTDYDFKVAQKLEIHETELWVAGLREYHDSGIDYFWIANTYRDQIRWGDITFGEVFAIGVDDSGRVRRFTSAYAHKHEFPLENGCVVRLGFTNHNDGYLTADRKISASKAGIGRFCLPDREGNLHVHDFGDRSRVFGHFDESFFPYYVEWNREAGYVFVFGNQKIEVDGAMSFYANGHVKTATLKQDYDLQDFSGETRSFSAGETLRFDEQGRVR